MSRKVTTLAAASAFLLSAAMPALAQDLNLNGNVSADYQNLDGHGSDARSWNGQGSVVTDTGTLGGLNLQGDLGYGRVITSPSDFDRWTIGADAIWRNPSQYALGAAVQSTKLEADGANEQVTSYGGFGQYYLDAITLDAKAGLFNGGRSFDGVYYGGGGTLYAGPNLGMSARIDRTQFNDVHVNDTDYGFKAEYLLGGVLGNATPLSVYGGYTRTNIDAFRNNDANVWLAGLKLYFGQGSLQDQQRGGAVDPTDTQLHPAGLF